MKGYVYSLVHKKSKRRYVGSTINLRRRTLEHFSSLTRGRWGDSILQALWDKEGRDGFRVDILWEGIVDTISTLRQIECRFLRKTAHEFNPPRKKKENKM